MTANPAPISWHCDLHRTWNFGDCPVCDDDMAAVMAMDDPKPANECARCAVPLQAGDTAWAYDVNVITPEGVKLETRLLCDECDAKADAL